MTKNCVAVVSEYGVTRAQCILGKGNDLSGVLSRNHQVQSECATVIIAGVVGVCDGKCSAGNLVAQQRADSEAHSHSQLKRARPARSEDLRGPAGGLPKGGARQITAVAGKVRFVVEVEHLADER